MILLKNCQLSSILVTDLHMYSTRTKETTYESISRVRNIHPVVFCRGVITPTERFCIQYHILANFPQLEGQVNIGGRLGWRTLKAVIEVVSAYAIQFMSCRTIH